MNISSTRYIRSFWSFARTHLLTARVFALSGVLCCTVMLAASCVDRLETSNGMTCEKSDDCWDNLPCVKEVCSAPDGFGEDGGAEAKPEPKPEPRPEPKPEPTPTEKKPSEKVTGESQVETVPEKVAETQPEPVVEKVADQPAGQCTGNVDPKTGFCSQDSDCCPGTTCMEINDPRVPQGTKICGPCAQDTDCPKGLQCCTAFKICAIQCAP
ncbi:MAG TPA: hypothetical protein DCE42_30985 [Myxococcales bacterium]|nr:hypothetical protein [Deltaproteobacteria bacterium]HAA59214.1 hypothetical protein [Myxococcales bacterium]